jgi:hypothetical protein
MKKILAALISLIVFAASFSFCEAAFAVKTTDVAKTQIGTSNTYYEFDASTKTLTFSGSGDIPNMANDETIQPWFSWRSDGSIENVVIEEGITKIGNYVLYQVSCKNISIPSTLNAIGNYAFAYNSLLESVELPFGVRIIGASAFENCISLKSASLPDTVTNINKSAFKQCYKLESIKIPHSVTSIGNYAFHRCSVLNSVCFEAMSSPVSIGSYAFMACPMLSEVSVPLNAKLNKYTFGYNDTPKLYDGFSMKVFSGSDAMTYAMARSIPYTLLDAIPLELGAENKNEYLEETVNNVHKYSFTPEISQKYNIYSDGEVDLRATLFENETELATGDDISKDNLNFCLSYELEAGKEYIINVSSVRSDGEYSVVVYPDEITSFDIGGELSFSADEANNGIFEITDEMAERFILSIDFKGFSDKIYYSNRFFNNRSLSLSDKQAEQPFTCGENYSYITIGEIESAYKVLISHSYIGEYVDMTLDDDGYTLYTCVFCGDSYKADFVPTTAVTVSGKAVLMENPNGSHGHNIPYKYAKFYANDRYYYIDENGSWSLRTFGSLDLIFENENGRDVQVHIDVDGKDVDFGAVAFEGYDFNGDTRVNAKDFAIFLKQKEESYGESYWDFAYNFI